MDSDSHNRFFGILPVSFRTFNCSDLIRCGRSNDGGYLVSLNDIKSSQALISFGINDDWSFEEQFWRINNVQVEMYDASISRHKFLNQCLKNFLNIRAWLGITRSISTFVRFYHFTKNRFIFHYELFIDDYSDNQKIDIDDVLKRYLSLSIFLKIDIEGGEYRCLDSILKYQENLTGLIIEFHDVDIHLERIEKFIAGLNLTLVYLHVNEVVRFQSGSCPRVIELTFSSKCDGEQNDTFNIHPLDRPNKVGGELVKIQFATEKL